MIMEMNKWTFKCHKMWLTSLLNGELLVSEEELCYVALGSLNYTVGFWSIVETFLHHFAFMVLCISLTGYSDCKREVLVMLLVPKYLSSSSTAIRYGTWLPLNLPLFPVVSDNCCLSNNPKYPIQLWIWLYCFLHSVVFYGIGMSTQCPTPNLEDQGVSLCLEPPSCPVQLWRPCQ
jgi:hypothetical protein